MIEARVYRSQLRAFECKILATGEVVTAKAPGNFLKGEESIVTGDFVTMEETQEHDIYLITQVKPRTNAISRLLQRESKKKVIATNCDLMVVICSVSKPAYKRGLVDRYLARAFEWGIEPLVVFNKMDEFEAGEFELKFEADRLSSLNIRSFEISAKVADYEKRFLDLGFQDLKASLVGKTSVFLGHSGVGKSKTINLLTEGKVTLQTKDISKSGKGSHTTTWSEIIDCGSFSFIDSPGIRSFSLEDIGKNDLLPLFPDLATVAAKCRFNNCNHAPEAKGCAFFEGMDPNEYDSRLIHSRLESYLKILEEITQIPEWKK